MPPPQGQPTPSGALQPAIELMNNEQTHLLLAVAAPGKLVAGNPDLPQEVVKQFGNLSLMTIRASVGKDVTLTADWHCSSPETALNLEKTLTPNRKLLSDSLSKLPLPPTTIQMLQEALQGAKVAREEARVSYTIAVPRTALMAELTEALPKR